MFHFCHKMHHSFYTLGIMDHLDFILRTQCAVTETISLRPVRLSPQFCVEKDTEPGSKMFSINSENGQFHSIQTD
jgi:hypothetical protein